MAHLFPPMHDEPPPDYLSFVAARQHALRQEAFRLTGGDRPAGDAIELAVLADVAGHWRRLLWQSRLGRRDAHDQYLRRRLATRTKAWREEQPYPVEVQALPPTSRTPAPRAHPAESVALRLASLLPTTVREQSGATAEAGIAWEHAHRRAAWWRHVRVCVGFLLVLFYLVRFMEQASAGS